MRVLIASILGLMNTACLDFSIPVDLEPVDVNLGQLVEQLEQNAPKGNLPPNATCEARLAYYVFEGGELRDKIPDNLDGSEYGQGNKCEDVDMGDWVADNLLDGARIVYAIQVDNSASTSECQARFRSPDRLSLDYLHLNILTNSLNLPIPESNIYAATKELPDQEFNEQTVPELAAEGALVNIGKIPEQEAGQTGEIEVVLNEETKNQLISLITAPVATLVLFSEPIELGTTEIDGKTYFLKPDGELEIQPKLQLTVRVNIGDLDCVGELTQ